MRPPTRISVQVDRVPARDIDVFAAIDFDEVSGRLEGNVKCLIQTVKDE